VCQKCAKCAKVGGVILMPALKNLGSEKEKNVYLDGEKRNNHLSKEMERQLKRSQSQFLGASSGVLPGATGKENVVNVCDLCCEAEAQYAACEECLHFLEHEAGAAAGNAEMSDGISTDDEEE
jgi:ABC-type lipoprotein export system ATPase subunit